MDRLDFANFWQLFDPETEFCNRRYASLSLWERTDQQKREAIITYLEKGNRPKNRNPYFFIFDFETGSRQTLSYREYYTRFHTTEEQGGWRMVKPENGNVYYEHR